MPDAWLRGGDQRRAKREKQARHDAWQKFGLRLQAADVRRLAVECLAGDHGDPASTHQGQGQAVRYYRVALGTATAYARVLVENEEIAGFATREEWAEVVAKRAIAARRKREE